MQLIAFTGLKQSGKTTLSKYLVAEHGYQLIGFKDALIEEVKERFPWTLHWIAGSEGLSIDKEITVEDLFAKKPYLPIIRLLLQEYGTEVRRKDDKHYWVDEWARKFIYASKPVVVDDCRFLNEAKAIKVFNGLIIRIIRPSLGTNTDPHQSETEQEQIQADHTLINDGTEQDLINKLNICLQKDKE